MASLYAPGSVVSVRALLLGERLDLKGLEAAQRLASNPLLISAGDGQYAALFRYGGVVLFGRARSRK
jgi:required for meiotic nuclear division protein 1